MKLLACLYETLTTFEKLFIQKELSKFYETQKYLFYDTFPLINRPWLPVDKLVLGPGLDHVSPVPPELVDSVEYVHLRGLLGVHRLHQLIHADEGPCTDIVKGTVERGLSHFTLRFTPVQHNVKYGREVTFTTTVYFG